MRQQSLEEFTEKEEIQGPYELPEGWRWVRLGEISKINPSKKEISHLSDDLEVSFIPMDAVDEGKGEIVNPQIRRLGEVRKGYTYFKEGDVIFAKITPCMENGKCAIANDLMNKLGFGSTEFHVVRPTDSLLSDWIWRYLRQQSIRDQATKYFTGSVGQQRVPKEFLERLQIPLPPLEDQKRIVARIEELFSKIDKVKKLRKEALEQVKALMPSALHQVFSKADEMGWKWVRLGEVAFMRKQTIDPKDYPDEEFELYSIPAYHEIGFPEIKKGSEIGSSKFLVKPQDVLFGKLNPHIPKVWIVKNPAEMRQIATTEFFPIYPKNSKELLNGYLFWSMKYSKFLDSVVKLVIGTTGSRKRLQKGDFLNLKIPLPPLEEQKRIVVYLDKIHQKAQALQKLQEETEKEVEMLREAILYKAFRGEL
jgi:type I restriction enzyme S subunit